MRAMQRLTWRFGCQCQGPSAECSQPPLVPEGLPDSLLPAPPPPPEHVTSCIQWLAGRWSKELVQVADEPRPF